MWPTRTQNLKYITVAVAEILHGVKNSTRSSAIAEGPRDASCHLKYCQLPRNSAETTCTTSPEEIKLMKLEGCVRQRVIYTTALNHDEIESFPLSYRCHKQTDHGGVVEITCIPTTCSGEIFLSTMLTWPWPRPHREHSLITRLRLHMADPCTKF